MFEWCSISEITISSPAPTLRAAVRRGDEVDRLGRAAHEDDLARLGGVEEPPHPFRAPPRTHRSRRSLSEMHAAMDVRVLLAVVARQPSMHGLRLLRRRRVVEIDERLAVDALPENREVLADGGDVESRLRAVAEADGRHRRPSLMLRPEARARAAVADAPRRLTAPASSGSRFSTSPANA